MSDRWGLRLRVRLTAAMTSLRLPLSTTVLVQWALSSCPDDFTFCSLSLNLNVRTVRTQVHQDVNNDDADNLILPVSNFSQGQVWVEAPDGDHHIQVAGKSVAGILHDVSKGPVRFYAKGRLHCTLPWRGERLVLILYSGGAASHLKGSHYEWLVSLGLRL